MNNPSAETNRKPLPPLPDAALNRLSSIRDALPVHAQPDFNMKLELLCTVAENHLNARNEHLASNSGLLFDRYGMEIDALLRTHSIEKIPRNGASYGPMAKEIVDAYKALIGFSAKRTAFQFLE